MTRPARPALLALSVLLFATVACSQVRGAGAPQATERANGVGAVSGSNNAPQATPDAFLMGENQALATSTEAPAIPTADATKARMLADLVALKQRVEAAEQAQQDQAERISQNAAQAAAANERAARLALTQAVVDNSTAQETTAQQQAENERILLQVRKDEADAATKRAENSTVEMVAFVAVVVACALVLARILWLNPPVREAEAEPGEWKRTTPNQIVRVGSSSDKSVQVSDAALERYIEYAMRGSMLGVNNAISALKNIVDKADVETLTDYVTVNGYSSPMKLVRGGTTNVLNASGEQWAREELERIHNHPAPLSDVPETTPSTRHERAETHVFTEGEGVSDDFSIIDPATRDQFTPPKEPEA